MVTLTEKQIQRSLELSARDLGFRVYHTWMSVRSTPGFPDLCLVGMIGTRQEGRLIFIECKSQRGHITDAQRSWLDDLASVPGVEVYEAWPHTYDAVLDALAPPLSDDLRP